MEALVGEIQPDHPPEIAGDAGPGTAGVVVGAPSGKPRGLAVQLQAIGEVEKRLQVGGMARLVQGLDAMDMKVEQHGDDQEAEQPAKASHLRREAAAAGSGEEALFLQGMNDGEGPGRNSCRGSHYAAMLHASKHQEQPGIHSADENEQAGQQLSQQPQEQGERPAL